MTSFELEWLRTEKERHARLLHQLRRDLVHHPKLEMPQAEPTAVVEKQPLQGRYGHNPNRRTQAAR